MLVAALVAAEAASVVLVPVVVVEVVDAGVVAPGWGAVVEVVAASVVESVGPELARVGVADAPVVPELGLEAAPPLPVVAEGEVVVTALVAEEGAEVEVESVLGVWPPPPLVPLAVCPALEVPVLVEPVEGEVEVVAEVEPEADCAIT